MGPTLLGMVVHTMYIPTTLIRRKKAVPYSVPRRARRNILYDIQDQGGTIFTVSMRSGWCSKLVPSPLRLPYSVDTGEKQYYSRLPRRAPLVRALIT